jgi:hypothetical protein
VHLEKAYSWLFSMPQESPRWPFSAFLNASSADGWPVYPFFLMTRRSFVGSVFLLFIQE